jgi:hypothetical protein
LLIAGIILFLDTSSKQMQAFYAFRQDFKRIKPLPVLQCKGGVYNGEIFNLSVKITLRYFVKN